MAQSTVKLYRARSTLCEGLPAYTGTMKRAAAFFREALSPPMRDWADVARVDLVLRLPEGEAWTVSFSPGIERFIGHYPRLDGIAPEGTLLSFSRT